MSKFDNIALVVVDLQNDFCEGGSLEVRNASEIIPKINEIRQYFNHVIFTKDWHPANHTSFKSNQENLESLSEEELGNLWPDHCVENTFGSELHKDVEVLDSDIIVLKGMNKDVDSYSGFGHELDKTNLHENLQNLGVHTIFICGLALDYCVLYTAIDALKLGYKVYILEDCSMAIDPSKVEKKFSAYRNSACSTDSNLEEKSLLLLDSKNILKEY